MGKKKLLDEYELKARQLPAFILIAPIIITLYLWFPSLSTIGKVLGGLVSTLGITYLASKLIRDKGKRLQSSLIKEWGGALPSTLILRHRDSTLDSVTKKRYHKYLEHNVPGLKMPTKEEEENDPKSADDKYNSAIKWLLSNTRDTKKYNLIFKDNITFGFSRNLLSVKILGVIISLFSLLKDFILFLYKYNVHALKEVNINVYIAFTISIIFLYIWICLVNKRWVKSNGYAFARSLLETCDMK
ncbi:hypothetical protein D9O40_18230 [Clostridium autoethanogenum]|uniref:Uncharacterized protein n=1 Tax=Clostridium autoethanogenum TaxID=84023 RepID=A0A3M0S3C1_9CLOT|nr:hypothetical protein [Clostridium autoethanogenum]RMC93018.1 hypothetical protein D9O40_18230 [Clostridium autoethanogenum]